jgi:hypothetical protein
LKGGKIIESKKAAQRIQFMRQMNPKTSMRIIGKKLLFLILPLAIAVTPLQAQTDDDPAPSQAPANPVVETTNSTASSAATNSKPARAHHPVGQVTINQGPHESGPTLPELAIIVSMTFFLPVCIVALVTYYRHRRSVMLHDTLRLMIEKGAAIPPELLQPPVRFNLIRKGNDLRTGMIFAGIGLGLLLIRMFDDHADVGAVGFIPLFIGVAFLISWKLTQKSDQPGK